MNKKLPYYCPSCNAELEVTELGCPNCNTKISGKFPLPVFVRMEESDQQFMLDFIKCSGSLKTMAKQLQLSYPTVRNRLDEIIEKLTNLEKKK